VGNGQQPATAVFRRPADGSGGLHGRLLCSQSKGPTVAILLHLIHEKHYKVAQLSNYSLPRTVGPAFPPAPQGKTERLKS
jgi:hypothetical protein